VIVSGDFWMVVVAGGPMPQALLVRVRVPLAQCWHQHVSLMEWLRHFTADDADLRAVYKPHSKRHGCLLSHESGRTHATVCVQGFEQNFRWFPFVQPCLCRVACCFIGFVVVNCSVQWLQPACWQHLPLFIDRQICRCCIELVCKAPWNHPYGPL
jgi:hypothetical protein